MLARLLFVVFIYAGVCACATPDQNIKKSERKSQHTSGSDCRPIMNGDGSVWKVSCRR